jgi:hypothetical protein
VGRSTLPPELDAAIRESYRRSTIVVGALVVVAFAVIALLGNSGGGSLGVWPSAYPIFFAVLFVFAVLAARRSERQLRELISRIRDKSLSVTYVRRIGLRVIFDNGLVLQGYHTRYVSGAHFLAFFDEGGQPLVPEAGNVATWIKTFRPLRERAGVLSRWRGPTASRGELKSIQGRLGAKNSVAFLEAHSPGRALPWGTPHYLAQAIFINNQWMREANEILDCRPAILGVLASLCAPGRPDPSAS